MARPIQEPVTIEHEPTPGIKATKTRHPAFGQIVVHRVQGATNLYGSDFTHHGFVTVEIFGSEMHRDLSRDWYFARECKIEVAMSEAQWATFVSSFNIGSGVPCTILHENGVTTPGLPERSTFRMYSEEAQKQLAAALDSLRACEAEVMAATSKLTKKAQSEVQGPIRRAIQTITSSLPFVKKQFDEHIEESVERAKVEANAYLMNAVRASGLKALSNAPVPDPKLVEGSEK